MNSHLDGRFIPARRRGRLRAAAAAAVAVMVWSPGFAQTEPPGLEPAPEPPPLPEPVRSGEALEPDVRIIATERETVHEYRINGRLVGIKVIPRGGPTYYLVDADGDGELETRRNELDPPFLVNGWELFRW